MNVDAFYDSRDSRRAGYIEALENAWALADDIALGGGNIGELVFRLEGWIEDVKRNKGPT